MHTYVCAYCALKCLCAFHTVRVYECVLCVCIFCGYVDVCVVVSHVVLLCM